MDKSVQNVVDKIIEITEDQVYVFDGSLAQACAKALNETMPKPFSMYKALATESLVSNYAFSTWMMFKEQIDEIEKGNKNVGVIYSLVPNEATMGDDIALNDTVKNMTERQKRNSILYIGDGKENMFTQMCVDTAEANGLNIAYGETELKKIVYK